MRGIIFILFIVIPVFCFGKRPSTLETVFSHLQDVQSENWNKAVQLYKDGDRKEAANYFYKAHLEGKENKNVKLETAALSVHATLLLYQRKSKEAEQYYLQILDRPKEESDSYIRAVTHSSIGFMYSLQGKISKSIYHNKEYLFWAENEQDDPFELASAMRTLGLKYSSLRMLDTAYTYFMKAHSIHEKYNHPEGLLRSYHALSIYHNDIDSYEESIRYDLLWLEKADELGFRSAQRVQVYNGMAISFIEIGDWNQAELYALKAMELAEELKLVAFKANAQGTLAQIKSHNQEYDQAKELYDACIEAFTDQAKMPALVQTYNGLCNTLIKEGNYREAERVLLKSIALSDSVDVVEYRWNTRDLYGALLIKEQRWKEAYKVLSNAYDLSVQYDGLSGQAQISQRLAQVCDELDRNTEALRYYRNTLVLKDSLSEMNSKEHASLMATRFRFNEQQAELNELDLKNEILEIKSEANKRRLYYLTGVLVLLSVLLASLFKLYRKSKSQEKIISNALADREILLKEIHHRVKNNLQVISSLLSMHSRQINDPEAQQAMLEGRNRVKSMALIHQNLYNDDDLVNVNTSEYINKLIYSIIYSYKMTEDDIDLDINVDDIQMDVDTMIPVGLVINELVSNAIKYAFNSGKGKLRVSLTDAQSSYKLEVHDSGPGFKEVDVEGASTLGYKIINAFVKKLKASLLVKNDNGAFVALIIPK